MTTGNFHDERHALYVGWVLGLAWRNGIAAEPVMDDAGDYTDRLDIRLPHHPERNGLLWVNVTLVVPPPPDDWTPQLRDEHD